MTKLQTTFIDPSDFDIDDATEVHGVVLCEGIDASEPNDCDNQGAMAECGIVRCLYCGRRLA